MYKLKPVFRVPLELQNTCTMYKLKNLHEKTVDAFNKVAEQDMISKIQLSNQELEVLLKKQSDVLKTLEELELRMSKLDVQCSDPKTNVPVTEKQLLVSSTTCQVDGQRSEQNSVISNDIDDLIKTDTVVFADPDDPPYSLLALPILWPNVPWDISHHIHSSVAKDSKAFETIKSFKNVSCKDNKKKIKIFVIWQHTKPGPKVVRSPMDTLIGEVPFLRLLNQYLTTEKLSPTDQANSKKVLDSVHEISCSINDRTSELLNLINVLDTKLDIKNIALWSLLFKKNKSSPKVEKWLEQLTKLFIS